MGEGGKKFDKKARKKKGLTEAQLGALVGLSQGYISKIENSNNYYDNNLSVKTIIRISKVLNLNPVDVFIFITGCSINCQKCKRICPKRK